MRPRTFVDTLPRIENFDEFKRILAEEGFTPSDDYLRMTWDSRPSDPPIVELVLRLCALQWKLLYEESEYGKLL